MTGPFSRTASIYDRGLAPDPANHVPLSPLSFLKRAAKVYPGKLAILHGRRTITYAQFLDRVRRFAGALLRAGVGRGDTVSVLAPNVPALLEAHYAVPLAGAVLNALNTRLDAAAIAFILDHSETRLLIVDRELSPVAKAALARTERPIAVVEIADGALASSSGREHQRPFNGSFVGPHVGRGGISVGVQRFVSVAAHDCSTADALTKVVLAAGIDAKPILGHFGAIAYFYEAGVGWVTLQST